MKQQFWFDDISILANQDYLQDFIPTKDMELNEKLNAIMRFCIYLSLILVLSTANANYIFIAITGAVLTYVMYINKDIQIQQPNAEDSVEKEFQKYVDEAKNNNKKAEAEAENEEIRPTPNNIFGNVIHLGDKKTQDPPKSLYDNQFEELIKQDDFPEQDHLYVDKMSLRQFYKVPNTFDSDSRKKFLNWCYEPMAENNEK
jgi:hypothetical protein